MRFFKILLGIIVIGLMIFVLGRSDRIVIPKTISFLSKPPQPGTCLILEEKYCGQGHFVYPFDGNTIAVGFSLPAGTEVYSPYSGITGFLTSGDNASENLPNSIVVNDAPTGADLAIDHKFIVFFANSFLSDEIHETTEKGQLLSKIEGVDLPEFSEYNLVVVIDNPAKRGAVYADPSFYLTDMLAE